MLVAGRDDACVRLLRVTAVRLAVLVACLSASAIALAGPAAADAGSGDVDREFVDRLEWSHCDHDRSGRDDERDQPSRDRRDNLGCSVGNLSSGSDCNDDRRPRTEPDRDRCNDSGCNDRVGPDRDDRSRPRRDRSCDKPGCSRDRPDRHRRSGGDPTRGHGSDGHVRSSGGGSAGNSSRPVPRRGGAEHHGVRPAGHAGRRSNHSSGIASDDGRCRCRGSNSRLRRDHVGAVAGRSPSKASCRRPRRAVAPQEQRGCRDRRHCRSDAARERLLLGDLCKRLRQDGFSRGFGERRRSRR